MTQHALKFKTRILLLCVLPVACVTILVLFQTVYKLKTFKENQIKIIKESSLEDRKTRLSLLINTAISSLQHLTSMPPSKDRDQQVINIINQLSYNNNGYYFANSFNHIGIANGRKPENYGKDYNKILEPEVLARFNKMVEYAKDDGGFLETRTKKKGQAEDDNTHFLKVTHVKKIPNYDWYIGTGFFVDDIEAITNQKTQEFNRAITETLVTSVLFAILLTIIAFILGWLFMRKPLLALTDMHKAMKNIASGDGDLTQNLTVHANDEIGECATSFNAFSNKIRHTVCDVIDASFHINIARDNLDRSTSISVSSMQSQKKHVASFQTSTSSLLNAAQDITDNTHAALELVEKTNIESKQTVESLNLAIQRVNELHNDIDESSNHISALGKEVETISSVINVIQEIAEQTNLLALNAAIEAARAGDQGRGFAVVADEVRTLASRTQASTEDINAMISNLQNGTSKAIESMNVSQARSASTLTEAENSKTMLQSMAISVSHINDMNIQIANAAAQQTDVTGELNYNSKLLLAMTEESEKEIEKVSLTSENLKENSDKLKEKTAHFKV